MMHESHIQHKWRDFPIRLVARLLHKCLAKHTHTQLELIWLWQSKKEWTPCHIANERHQDNWLRLIGNPTIYYRVFLYITSVACILPSVPGTHSCRIGQSHVKFGQTPCTCRMITQLQKGHVKNLEKALGTAIYSPLLPMWRENKHVANEKKTCTVLMWSLQVITTALVKILTKFSVLRSCAPIHHMIMTIPWPWPPYHHHHDFNHLYPPKLQE